ncbi:hypothetical protein GJ744_000433 [Endocarpon pusillum]|uniref:Uncharacterized protein n=1 Tax=Endocarpon pusillum TaxID=364733 RepID=A0A8H7AES7_9EURO|nr:hypothetical protein GJ744_000433 [Endocarpon pusillum]
METIPHQRQRPLPPPLASQRRYLIFLIIVLSAVIGLAFIASSITILQPLNHKSPHPSTLSRDCITCFTSSGQAYCCQNGPPKTHVPIALIVGLSVGLGVPLLIVLWYVWCCCCFDASMA